MLITFKKLCLSSDNVCIKQNLCDKVLKEINFEVRGFSFSILRTDNILRNDDIFRFDDKLRPDNILRNDDIFKLINYNFRGLMIF